MRSYFTFLAIGACVLANAQAVTFTDILSGANYPTRIAAKDLPANFKAVQLKLGTSDYMSSMMPFVAMGPSAKNSADVYNAFLSHWTSGEVVTAENNRFLITYKTEIDMGTLMARADDMNGRGLSKQLVLELVKVDSIAALSPLPLFTKERLLAAIGDPSMAPEQTEQTIAARKTQTISNMKQIALGAMMYSNDYDDVLPFAQNTATVQRVIRPYLKNDSLWKTMNPNGGRILFNMNVGGV
ncbi:MAG: hypothetical protein ACAH95_07520, partial [Fimbriimonas sp.]